MPYPEAKGLGIWGLFYPFIQSLGLVALAATALPWLHRFHPVTRALIIAMLFATMNGIVRNALMAGVATTDFGGSLAVFLQQALLDLILGALAVAAVSILRGTVLRIVVAIALLAASIFLFIPALASLLAPVIAWSARHTHADVYLPPMAPVCWCRATCFSPKP